MEAGQMEKYLYPWQSHVMLDYPWLMPLFLFALAVIFSVAVWIRGKK